MILAGDIGGTKTVLALFEESDVVLTRHSEQQFGSRDHATFGEILEKFLAGHPGTKIEALCLGVAGAVIEGKVKTTNLPWSLDEEELSRVVKTPRVKLLNDLEAMAYGMLFLQPGDLAYLQRPTNPARKGNIAVIAAGTGLGEAMLYWDGKQYHPLASEGGHCDFAPQSDLEIDLLKYLRGKFGHVSYERVLSGPGFLNIYDFLLDSGFAPESEGVRKAVAEGTPRSVAVTLAGLSDGDPLSLKTIELFCWFYGAEAGNLALKCLAVGGIYIGGGIAPKMLPAMQKEWFLNGLHSKGRFEPMLRDLEVRVSLRPDTPLIGAANYATRL